MQKSRRNKKVPINSILLHKDFTECINIHFSEETVKGAFLKALTMEFLLPH